MGKKKIKEVAGTSEEQPSSPRKRGRPRKIVKKSENEEIKQMEKERESKSVKIREEEEPEPPLMKGIESSSTSVLSEAVKEEVSEEGKKRDIGKSRGRRKSQPHKSS